MGKENLRLKNKDISDHHNELKRRWVEYKEDENFYKNTKRKEKLNKKNNEKETTKVVKAKTKEEQKELEVRWLEQETKRKSEIRELKTRKSQNRGKIPNEHSNLAELDIKNEKIKKGSEGNMKEEKQSNSPPNADTAFEKDGGVLNDEEAVANSNVDEDYNACVTVEQEREDINPT